MQTDTGQQTGDPAPDQNDDFESGNTPSKPDRTPAAAGTGQIVDRLA